MERHIEDEVMDVAGSGENATTKETTCGAAATQRGDTAATLHARGGGVHTMRTDAA